MTTLNGTIVQCSNGDTAFSYACDGASCYGVSEFPDSACSSNSSTTMVYCTNSITCDGPPLFTSNFSLIQVGNSFERVDAFDISGNQFVLRGNASSNSTSTTGKLNETISVGNWSSPASATSTASPRKLKHRNSGLVFGCLVLLLIQLFPNAMASSAIVNSIAEGSTRHDIRELSMTGKKDDRDGYVRPHQAPEAVRDNEDIFSGPVRSRALTTQQILNALKTALEKHVAKFGQSAGKKIFTSPPAEKCSLSLSPKRPWYQQITHDSFDGICKFVAQEASLLDAVGKNQILKPLPLQRAEKTCANAARASIFDFGVDLAWATEGLSLAASLAAWVVAEIVCKAALSLLVDYSVSDFLANVCIAGGNFIDWTDFTSQDGLPCRDKGIPVTQGIVPAAVPTEVTPPPAQDAFSYAELAKFPCAIDAVTTKVDSISIDFSPWTLPDGLDLADALCNGTKNHGEDTDVLCAQVCADQCKRYGQGLDDFMKKYYNNEWWEENVENNPDCSYGPKWLLGSCGTYQSCPDN